MWGWKEEKEGERRENLGKGESIFWHFKSTSLPPPSIYLPPPPFLAGGMKDITFETFFGDRPIRLVAYDYESADLSIPHLEEKKRYYFCFEISKKDGGVRWPSVEERKGPMPFDSAAKVLGEHLLLSRSEESKERARRREEREERRRERKREKEERDRKKEEEKRAEEERRRERVAGNTSTPPAPAPAPAQASAPAPVPAPTHPDTLAPPAAPSRSRSPSPVGPSLPIALPSETEKASEKEALGSEKEKAGIVKEGEGEREGESEDEFLSERKGNGILSLDFSHSKFTLFLASALFHTDTYILSLSDSLPSLLSLFLLPLSISPFPLQSPTPTNCRECAWADSTPPPPPPPPLPPPPLLCGCVGQSPPNPGPPPPQ